MTNHTLPRLLLKNQIKYGSDKIALREKEFGIWQEYSWQDYFEHVKCFAMGLDALNIKKGDTLAIIGDNRPEWIWAELAAQSLGAIPLGIYQDSILEEVAYVIKHSDAKILIAEDQEQCDKILSLKADIPDIIKLVYTDNKGMRSYNDPFLMSFTEVENLGKEKHASDSQFFEKKVDLTDENDVALIAYTSGTTGFPKGSILTHKNMLSMAISLNKIDPKYESDEFFSFLPLPWVGEQMMGVCSALFSGFTVNFPEQPETAMADLFEIGPNVLFSPPRIWEGMSRSIMVRIQDATLFKRICYNLSLTIGYKWADFKFDKIKPPWYWKAIYKIAYIIMFRALRDRLGFSNLRSAMTGGALLGPDVFKFFHALGINLKQMYGQTEMSGISTIHRSGDIQFDTVGPPIPGTEIKISPEGEILSRGDALFQEYWKNPKATAETIVGGWLRSGDAGYFTKDGHLVCIDRLKDMMKLKDSTKFSPIFIENKLKFCPFIVEAMVLGPEREFITAIICIDFSNCGKWAEKNRVTYTTYTDLASKKELYNLIEKEIYRVNKTLPDKMQIRKFLLLYKELDADDEELTRTRKLRRKFITGKYSQEIEALYGNKETVSVESKIRYQDGKTYTMQTSLDICALKSNEEYESQFEKMSWWKKLIK